jgi:DNA-binding Lrp family transcriptional regulator
MAIHAYVFIECTPGNPILVAEGLRSVPGVEMAHAVTGAYDVIAFVRAETLAVLGELISARIHRLSGVLKTTTNVVVESEIVGGPAGRARGKRG